MQRPFSAVKDVIELSSGIQSDAERIFPRCSIRTPSSARANDGSFRSALVQARNAQRASLRFSWLKT